MRKHLVMVCIYVIQHQRIMSLERKIQNFLHLVQLDGFALCINITSVFSRKSLWSEIGK